MSTGYSAGMRQDRIRILNRTKAETSAFGIDGNGIEWEETDQLAESSRGDGGFGSTGVK